MDPDFESTNPIVIRSHSEIQLCTYTVFPATPAKFLLQGNKYTEEEYDMSSREKSSTMENVQKDIQCLRKVFSIVRLVKATHPEDQDTADGSGLSACDDDSR